MQLDILSGRHVTDAGGIAICKLRHASQLVRGNAAEWDLDPYHLHTRLTLAINAILKSEGFEEIGREALRPTCAGLNLEGFDLFENGRRNQIGHNIGDGEGFNCSYTDLLASSGKEPAKSDVVHRSALSVDRPLTHCQVFDRNAFQNFPFRLLNLIPDVA